MTKLEGEDHSNAKAERVAAVASADAQIPGADTHRKGVTHSHVYAAISVECEVAVGYRLIDGGRSNSGERHPALHVTCPMSKAEQGLDIRRECRILPRVEPNAAH